MDLLPPFAYLKEVTDRLRKGGGFEGKTKTSAMAGQCSSLLSLSDPTDTQNEPKNAFSSPVIQDVMQFLEYISFPQQSVLKHLLTDE